jgi:hypothetical protein
MTDANLTRPYCLRCEVPIYQDKRGAWRREATGSDHCPRNPARDGHEPQVFVRHEPVVDIHEAAR